MIGFSEDRERIEVGETRKFVAIMIIIGLEDILRIRKCKV